MYEFDAYSNDELRTILQENGDKQYDLEREYVRMNSDEEECMQSLKADRSALETLSVGWTGKDAEKYISEAIEENERFRKQYIQAFSTERDNLLEKQKSLQMEEQSILETIASRSDEEQ